MTLMAATDPVKHQVNLGGGIKEQHYYVKRFDGDERNNYFRGDGRRGGFRGGARGGRYTRGGKDEKSYVDLDDPERHQNKGLLRVDFIYLNEY
jgi:hypothetical protein